jgi:predicted N-formylglutamate amidohydrolase
LVSSIFVAPELGDAFEIIGGPVETGAVILADHATNRLLPEYGTLGLPHSELNRHIAFDIGIDALTRRLAELLHAPAILSRFSRLLIDPNRGADDPTLVMRIADGALIPANARIGPDEIGERRRRFYDPYHHAIARTLDRMLGGGTVPVVISLHSFTPVMKGVARPWHAGILWDADPRLPVPLLKALAAISGLIVGDNEPYDGALAGDTIDQHATVRGLANALIEVRQDLISDAAGVESWAQLLAGVLKPLITIPDMRHQVQFPSRTRDRIRPHGRS